MLKQKILPQNKKFKIYVNKIKYKVTYFKKINKDGVKYMCTAQIKSHCTV